MKILILNTDYSGFLTWLYKTNPGLEGSRYDRQMAVRNDTLFGVSDAYSRAFRALGHDSREIHVNNGRMQAAWARERGLTPPDADSKAITNPFILSLKRRMRRFRRFLDPLAGHLGLTPSLSPVSAGVLLAQIEDYDPDVVINQELAMIDSKMMRRIVRGNRLLVAQCGIDPTPGLDVEPYDFGVSLLPWVVEIFEKKGLPAQQWSLGFDTKVLGELGPPPPKDIEISFVGTAGADHSARIKLLEAVAARRPLTLHLSSDSNLPRNSPLWDIDRGPVWGRQMYDVLRRSKITLNSHIGAARGMAGNMRLFEATIFTPTPWGTPSWRAGYSQPSRRRCDRAREPRQPRRRFAASWAP